MRVRLTLLLFFVSACSGPAVPSAFQAESPASLTATPAPRMSVAAVLAASNPIEASVCATGQACVLDAQAVVPTGGHDAMNHGAMNHGAMNHGAMNHGGMNHRAAPTAAPPNQENPPAPPKVVPEQHSDHNQ